MNRVKAKFHAIQIGFNDIKSFALVHVECITDNQKMYSTIAYNELLHELTSKDLTRLHKELSIAKLKHKLCMHY